MTFTLTEVLESQILKRYELRVLKRYKAIRESVCRLYEICPERFDAQPSLVGFKAEIFAPGNFTVDPSEWGFKEPLNMNAETFCKTYGKKASRTIDLSALVVGAKKGTFVYHLNIKEKEADDDPGEFRGLTENLRSLRRFLAKAASRKSFEGGTLNWTDNSTSQPKIYKFTSPQEVLELYRTKKKELIKQDF